MQQFAHDRHVHVVNLDLLTYAGNLESLVDVVERHGPGGDRRYSFVRGDIRDFAVVTDLLRGAPPVDAIVHCAAESHVDRSIMGPSAFVDTNVRGTLTMLEAEVIAAIRDGNSNKEIASRLSISEETVKRHLSNIYAKMGVSSRLELALLSPDRDLPLAKAKAPLKEPS